MKLQYMKIFMMCGKISADLVLSKGKETFGFC